MRFPIIPLALAATALAGCARTETPEEARAAADRIQAEYDRESAARAAAANGGANAIEGPGARVAEGEWVVSETSRGPVAAFGRPGATALLNVRCGEGGGLELRKPGTAVAEGTLVSYISLPEGESRLTASVDTTDPGAAFLFVPADDPFIERLIDSPGPITIRMGGERLATPSSPALVALVSGCGGDADLPSPITPAADASAPAPAPDDEN